MSADYKAIVIVNNTPYSYGYCSICGNNVDVQAEKCFGCNSKLIGVIDVIHLIPLLEGKV